MKKTQPNKSNKINDQAETKTPSKLTALVYSMILWGCIGFFSELFKNLFQYGFTLDVFKGELIATALFKCLFAAIIIGIPFYFLTKRPTVKKK